VECRHCSRSAELLGLQHRHHGDFPSVFRRFGYVSSLSGFLRPSKTEANGAIPVGLRQFGGIDGNGMWGAAQLGPWKWHDPYVHLASLAANNTRLWVFSTKADASDPATVLGGSDQVTGTDPESFQQHRVMGGRKGHFDFPAGGDNGWDSWSSQLGAISGDVAATIR
jgi:S-formylglutathione hydrolase FrmB